MIDPKGKPRGRLGGGTPGPKVKLIHRVQYRPTRLGKSPQVGPEYLRALDRLMGREGGDR